MGIWSWLTAGGKAVDTISNVVEAGVKGIDSLIFTDQEKQQASIKMFEVVLERIRLANSEGSVRSITRRVIAVMFTGVFLLMLVTAAALYPWFEDWATHIFKCSMVLKNAIIAIIIFYFGSYGVGYILEKKEKK